MLLFTTCVVKGGLSSPFKKWPAQNYNFANILEHFLSEAKKVLEDMRNSVGHFLSCDDSPDQSVQRGRRPLQKLRDCVWPNNSDMDRFAEFINMAQETRTKSLAPRSESTYQSYIDAYSHIMATERT